MPTFLEGTKPDISVGEITPTINIFLGPSAIGKSTIINDLLTDQPDRYAYPMVYVTRPPRLGEKNKVSISESEYLRMKSSNDIIVNDLYPVKYAVAKSEIDDYLNRGVSPLIDWALDSITSFDVVSHPTRRIYVTTPTIDEWLERIRLAGRSPDRIANGLAELTHLFGIKFNHPAIDYVVNNKKGARDTTTAVLNHLFATAHSPRIGQTVLL
jgi:guanylate kinase